VAGFKRWRLYRGQEMEVCVPAEWAPFQESETFEDGVKSASSSPAQIEVRLTGMVPPRDAHYLDFGQWIRDHALKGKSARVGTLRALREDENPHAPERTLRTYIALPNARAPGGVVSVFLLTVSGEGAKDDTWSEAYDAMLRSLRLLRTTVPEW
jgi:hypothetical protein